MWTLRPDRSVAAPHSWRGHLWALVIAVDFYLVSNPLVFEDSFFRSLGGAVLVTSLAVVVTFPWAPIPKFSAPLVAFLGWGLASAGWSIGPSSTLIFWLQAFLVAALAVTIAAQVAPLVLTEGLVLGGVLVSLLSWYAHLEELPGASFLTLDGLVGIAGVGTNRNILAYTLAIALGAVVAHVPTSRPGRLAWGMAALFTAFTLYSADSTTGYSAGLAAFVASLSVACYQRFGGWLLGSRLRLWSSTLGLASGLVAVLYTFARVGGEDILTISGRLPFWEAGWEVARDQLFRGYGWGAVWAHPWAPAGPNDVAARIYTEAGLFLSHGHNSLVDVLVELGLVGVALVLVIHGWILIKGARGAVRAAKRREGGAYARLLLATLAAISVTGISEPMSVIPVGWWSLLLLLHLAPASEESVVVRRSPAEADASPDGTFD